MTAEQSTAASTTTPTTKRKSKRSSIFITSRKKKRREKEYEVESIVSHTVVDGVVVYNVSWVGYPGEITELLEEDLENCGELLQAYKDKVGPCPEFEQKPVTSNGADENTDNNIRSELDDIIDGVASNSLPKAKRKNEGVETTGFAVTSNEKKVNGDGGHPPKRNRKAKQRQIAPDADLGYNNGCIVEEYKGFSTKYTEPVVLVTYKKPLPSGFENRQDEIVPIRVIAEKDPQRLISHLVELLSSGRTNAAH
ncbi:unnamed protein product [Cylicocyclus nassatus]|uniref:Chromo domain-containing protein n=1 Tax=Cylicocyclus nassatus TaxID=53992 RepID=A0AA36H5S9_CYLNA|nr:unnamed protein product [Cylicocyclus nassatus]